MSKLALQEVGVGIDHAADRPGGYERYEPGGTCCNRALVASGRPQARRVWRTAPEYTCSAFEGAGDTMSGASGRKCCLRSPVYYTPDKNTPTQVPLMLYLLDQLGYPDMEGMTADLTDGFDMLSRIRPRPGWPARDDGRCQTPTSLDTLRADNWPDPGAGPPHSQDGPPPGWQTELRQPVHLRQGGAGGNLARIRPRVTFAQRRWRCETSRAPAFAGHLRVLLGELILELPPDVRGGLGGF